MFYFFFQNHVCQTLKTLTLLFLPYAPPKPLHPENSLKSTKYITLKLFRAMTCSFGQVLIY